MLSDKLASRRPRPRLSTALSIAPVLMLAAACGGDAGADRGVEIEPLDTVTAPAPARLATTSSPSVPGVKAVASPAAPDPTDTPVAPPPTDATEQLQPTEPPVLPSSPAAVDPAQPPPIAPTATGALAGVRIYANGDSTSYFMSVAVLQGAVAQGAVQVQPAPEYQISSGLNNTSYFDWYGYLSAQMALYDPSVVVFMVGANDAHPGIDLNAYRQRVGAMMDQFKSRRLIWAGQPNMGRADLAAAIPGMNQVFREEAEKRPWVTYVDTWALTSDASGAFNPYMTDAAGAVILGRADDGVHFTSAGGAILGQAVLAAIIAG